MIALLLLVVTSVTSTTSPCAIAATDVGPEQPRCTVDQLEAVWHSERTARLIAEGAAAQRSEWLETRQAKLLAANKENDRLKELLKAQPVPERVEVTPLWVPFAVGGSIVGGALGGYGGDQLFGALGAGIFGGLGAATGAALAAAIPIAVDGIW